MARANAIRNCAGTRRSAVVPSCAWMVTIVKSASREAFLTTLAISSTSSSSGSVRMPDASPTTNRRPKKFRVSPAAGVRPLISAIVWRS